MVEPDTIGYRVMRNVMKLCDSNGFSRSILVSSSGCRET